MPPESRSEFPDWTEVGIQKYKAQGIQEALEFALSLRGKLGSTCAIAEGGTTGPSGGMMPNRRPLGDTRIELYARL